MKQLASNEYIDYIHNKLPTQTVLKTYFKIQEKQTNTQTKQNPTN